MTLFHRAGNLYVRLRMSRRDLFTVDVGDALRHGGRAVVFLPTNSEQIPDAIDILHRFARWFNPLSVVWIGTDEMPPDTFGSPVQVISVPNAVNRWGLPYSPIVKRIAKKNADIAIDLNPTFFQPTAYLSVISGAPLRIGFRSPREGFFNLEYSWEQNDERDLVDHYRRFAAMLTQIRSAKPYQSLMTP